MNGQWLCQDHKVFSASIETSLHHIDRSDVAVAVIKVVGVSPVKALVRQPKSWQVTFKTVDSFDAFINMGSLMIYGKSFPIHKVAESGEGGKCFGLRA